MKKLKVLAILVLVGSVGLLAYVGFGPWIALNGIQSALSENDPEVLERYIDFPALRENVKSQLSEKVDAQFSLDADNPFANLVSDFSDVLVKGMVEAVVTPAGLHLLLAGKSFSEKGNWLYENDQANGDSGETGENKLDLISTARFDYESHDTFHVFILNDQQSETQLTLKREGIFWRLSYFTIPINE